MLSSSQFAKRRISFGSRRAARTPTGIWQPLVAIEENQLLTLKPVEASATIAPSGEPVEPLLAVENAGEFPTLTDQGEEKSCPTSTPSDFDASTAAGATSSGSAPAPAAREKGIARQSKKRTPMTAVRDALR
jgi:hypothetical protein